MIVAMRRMEGELLATRALVHASLTSDSQVDPTVKAFKDYADKVLPFLATAQDMDKQQEREALFRFSKVRAKINKKMIYAKHAEKLNNIAPPDKFKIKPRLPGL